LRRLDQICSAMELTLADLMQPPEDLALVTQLSEAQEIALANQPKILVVTYLLVNDWKFQEIVSAFQMDDNELIDILLRLDRLKIIEYDHRNRVRKLTSRNFSWRTDGPVHKFFVTRFVPEYFQSAFGAPVTRSDSWVALFPQSLWRGSPLPSNGSPPNSNHSPATMRDCRSNAETGAAPSWQFDRGNFRNSLVCAGGAGHGTPGRDRRSF